MRSARCWSPSSRRSVAVREFGRGVSPSRVAAAVVRAYRRNPAVQTVTAEAWLGKYDGAAPRIKEILDETYGAEDAPRWFNRWRVFLMACAELWGFRGGQEWIVSHYLLQKRTDGAGRRDQA